VSHYAGRVADLYRVVTQKLASMNSTSPDAPLGTQQERLHELNGLRSQLAEAQQEYKASCEELEAAKAAVEAAAGVQP